MTWPEYYDLSEYWADHPPVHELVAAYIGYKRKAPAEETPQDLGMLLAMAPGGALNLRHLAGG
jgi:hypothetical protein